MAILPKTYTITDAADQSFEIDWMFDDLYGQLGRSLLGDGTMSGFDDGDLLYFDGGLEGLAAVATGNALISGGVGTAPSWGDIDLTTTVTGTLPVTNGGTGTATAFTAGSVVFAGASGIYTQDNANLFYNDSTNMFGVGTATPLRPLHVHHTSTPVVHLTNDTTGQAITDGLDLFVFSGNANLLYRENGQLQLGTNGTNYLSIHPSAGISLLSTTDPGAGIVRVTGTIQGSTLTTGSVLFAAANGAIAQDNANLFWNDTDNRLRIGAAASNTATVSINPGTLASSTEAFTIEATLGAAVGVSEYGADIFITSAASSIGDRQFGLAVGLAAGYTGTSVTTALVGNNVVAGTGDEPWLIDSGGDSYSGGNVGVRGISSATTIGYRYGVYGNANGGNVNFGVFGTTVTDKASARNIGVGGYALNAGASGTRFGGAFVLANTVAVGITALGNSAALLADNGANADDIFRAQDNGTAVFTIADGGAVTLTQRLNLPDAGTGIIYMGASPLIHAYNTVGNIFVGVGAGNLTNTGGTNTAVGRLALSGLTSGGANVAIGRSALVANTTGGTNTAVGEQAGLANTEGVNNVALGTLTLSSNLVGNQNVALGAGAGSGSTGDYNTFIGFRAGNNLTSGSNNLIIGNDVDAPSATGSGQLNIGNILFGTGVSGTGTTISSANLAIGTTTFPSTGTFSLIFGDGTIPATMGLNTAGIYANDVGGTVQMHGIHEDGTTGVLGLVVTKTDTGDPTGHEGLFVINTFDNTFKVYADGAFRTLASGW